MFLGETKKGGFSFPTLDFSIPAGKNEGALYGSGTGVFKTAANKKAAEKKAAEKKAAEKKAAEKTQETSAGLVPVTDAPPVPWLDQEVVVAGKPVKRKILVGVAGAAIVISLLATTSAKIVKAV